MSKYGVQSIPESIANKVFEAVEEGKFSRADVAKHYKISPSSIQRIMNKRHEAVKAKYKNIKAFEARKNES